MNRCKQCRQEIRGEWTRLDAGVTVDGKRLLHDVNLHPGECEGAWWLHNYPWLCAVRNVA